MFDEYLKLGIIEDVQTLGDTGQVVYLPYKEVVKEDRSTTKLRIVFDASAKYKDTISLNDLLPSQHFNVGSTLFQRCERWSDVENETKSDVGFSTCTTLIQRQCLTFKQRRNNVTLRQNNVVQRWYNVDTTLFQPSVDVSSGYIESNQASDDCGLWDSWIHVKYMNRFYSAKWENIFYNILTIQLLMKYQKFF